MSGKLLLILSVAIAMLSSCKKDTSSDVTITPADLAYENGQIKGSWVFPVKTLTIVDENGKALFPPQTLPASALFF